MAKMNGEFDFNN